MRTLLPALVLFAAAPVFAQDTASDDAVAALERRAEEIARTAAPSVVSVSALVAVDPAPQTILPGLVVAPPHRPQERLEAAGFMVDEGVVATTIEVARAAARFRIRFSDGTEHAAALLGTDDTFGIAFLRTDAPKEAIALTAATDDPQAGRRTFAWLVTPASGGGVEPQIAFVRPATCPESSYDRFLSGPICLQPGSAGAPLLAKGGGLLGMAVVSVAPPTSPPSESHHCRSTLFVRGDDVLLAAREIVRTGRVRRARLGVLLESDSNRVDQLIPGGPAELVGLREGDAIVSVAGTQVGSAAEVTRALLRRRAGDTIPLETLRAGTIVQVRVTLDDVAMPPLPATAPIAGAVLRWSWQDAGGGRMTDQVVTVTDVTPGSAADARGLRVGDEVVHVDGIAVMRFLSRHRVRPAAAAPAELVVRRDGAETRLDAPRR